MCILKSSAISPLRKRYFSTVIQVSRRNILYIHHNPFGIYEWFEYFYLNAVLEGSETAERPHSLADSLQTKQQHWSLDALPQFVSLRHTYFDGLIANGCPLTHMQTHTHTHTESMTSSADGAPATKNCWKVTLTAPLSPTLGNKWMEIGFTWVR